MNAFLQLGDVIEYRTTDKAVPKKGVIVSIGTLSSDAVIKVNDGTWLTKSKHHVKRVEISRGDGEKSITNPNPTWRSLRKVHIVTGIEEASDDEYENECDNADNVSTAETLFNTSESNCQGGDLDIDISVDEVPEAEELSHSGDTRQNRIVNQTRIRHEKKKNDSRRATETYLRWARPGSEYNKARRIVNKYYLACLAYGIKEHFYQIKLFDAPTKNEFDRLEKLLRNRIKYRCDNNFIKLDIRNDVVFMDNSRYGKRGDLNETNRERKAYEEMLMFEYQMRTLQMKTCIVCRENSLQFKDKEELIRDGASVLECGDNEYSFVCDKCKRNKLGVDDMYHLESNLHPIWYERDQNGDFRFDNEGNKVARYDIPSELKNLTMAEKLLIRRCSPLIPSHHIKNGVYGIDGHCVCFPQNIDQMCSDLPQQQSNMVIFVRHISNRVTGSEHSRHYKVNKNRVLSALRWLKIHHIGYHDITITESNLDWIQGDNVYESTKKYEFDTKYRKKDAVHNAEETVSSNQCGGNNDGQDEAGLETVHPNYKQNKPNPEQSEIIKSFKSTAEGTGQSHKVLDFPPIDHSEPLK